MSNPLDDAIRELRESGAKRTARDFIVADQDRRRAQFVSMTDDSLRRMSASGCLGASLQLKDGRRKVMAWSLIYDDSDKILSLILTVDGRVPYSETVIRRGLLGGNKYTTESGFRSFREAQVTFRDDHLRRLAMSMARLLPQH